MKIFDCFTFYNELDLLELRLEELYDHVDHFVLVEGCTTFTDLPKPYYFEENKDRYTKWLDKIIHVKVDNMPHSTDAWENEKFQRNSIEQGIETANDDDIIIISDVDEIVRPEIIDEMRQDTTTQIWGLRMPLFNFKFNYMLTTADNYSVWGMAGRKKVMVPAEDFRRQRFQLNSFSFGYNKDGIRIMEHAGWQFTYLGDTAFAENKIKSFAHTETNTPEIIEQLDVERSIKNGDGILPHPNYRFSIVKLDDYFPKTIRNNLDKYSSGIVEDMGSLALDFLPQQ